MSDPNLDPNAPTSSFSNSIPAETSAPETAAPLTPALAPEAIPTPEPVPVAPAGPVLPQQSEPMPFVTDPHVAIRNSFAAEKIAPEPIHANTATTPLMAMLAGAVLACFLVGVGILIGRVSGDGGLANGLSGVNSSSGSAIVRAAAEVGPSVMNVDTTFGQDDSKSDFLPSPGSAPAQQGPRAGKGTGFIIDSKKGWMLTNAHVVAGAKKIQVTTREGKKYAGRVMGFDRQTDIAVVILDNKNLPQAKLATFKDAKELPIGDWTIAIGNPFGQANTVTVGVLSAVGRTLPVPENQQGDAFALTDMMQTDTAINPGNSGGPLCNLKGEVIGINTAIIPFGQGLGFTIPISKAKGIADQIIKNGKVFHPYVGVVVTPITDEIRSDQSLPDKNGGLVKRVQPNSPADKAGLQTGDVIRKMDGQVMKTNEDVVKYIGKKKVGDTVKMEILRNSSEKQTLNMKVGDRPG
ncbi:PDZ domain-containing protein [bacterium]|nr:MAG: PDZ domain-containing protein [bacterium]